MAFINKFSQIEQINYLTRPHVSPAVPVAVTDSECIRSYEIRLRILLNSSNYRKVLDKIRVFYLVVIYFLYLGADINTKQYKYIEFVTSLLCTSL